MENKQPVYITCILCPYGCQVQVEKVNGEYILSGSRCKKGNEYALKELTNPMRILTTTVKTIFPEFPRLPVKTDHEIKLQDIFRYMQEINLIVIDKKLKPGDFVKKCLMNQDINLIATDNMLD